MRTIIVDDSVFVRGCLIDILSAIPDVEIIGKESEVYQAVASIRLEEPDLVILDIRLTCGSGIDVLHEIKHANPDIKVIIFTGYPFLQYRRECMEKGADAFLDKSNGFGHIKPIIQCLSSEAKRNGGRDEA